MPAPRLPFDPYRPRRRATRVVRVGDVGIGGDEPIRIQSMTNTNTLDTDATVRQVERLAAAGCEIVRITAPSIRDAENLREIKQALRARGVRVPLVADIHFTPNAAMIAAEIVEKVRINPGNYADKKRFEVREYDDAEYAEELERVAARFRPLVLRCRQNGVAMRIGTNHGSLSDRVMNRFGDTPEGMVESALEFLDVCEAEGFFDVVFSMKSSNTQVAIAAYRLLAARLEERAPGRPSYPFHVGVTEAGDAEDGRIKSAIDIGALLEDGIGDTIRVSLTEDPVREVPVAREIARLAGPGAPRRAAGNIGGKPGGNAGGDGGPLAVTAPPFADPFAHARRATRALRLGRAGLELPVGGDAPVRVELDRPDALLDPVATAARLAVELAALRDVACESLLVTAEAGEPAAAADAGAGATAGAVAVAGAGDALDRVARLGDELASLGVALPISLRLDAGNAAPVLARLGKATPAALGRIVARIDVGTPDDGLRALAEAAGRADVPIEWELAAGLASIPGLVRRALDAAAKAGGPGAPMFGLACGASPQAVRVLVSALADAGAEALPVVLRGAIARAADAPEAAVSESALLEAAIGLGSSLCDGIGDLVSLEASGPAGPVVDLAYRILQGARLRTTRTEYISCPSCGRTLFDLEETTAKIKQRTVHLSGVKIAVMGCIVNGPGEMADADFGYVGSGVGQVTLYVGKEIVERAVPEAEAPDRLVDLIKRSGRWVDA
ncbi:MAG: (E)-4-hydroxy-3-methylbut-2-enyl-diphosphate synthase [Myxococcota bacterium]